jgi:hypothetical protein
MARAIGWLLLAAVLALGGAGLVGQLSHPPGDARRAELTATADAALSERLDDFATGLEDVGSQVDGLAEDARLALAAVSSGDATTISTALDHGATRVATIDAATAALHASLESLPGAGAAAATQYSNDVLVRRAALAAALGAVGSLSDEWAAVTARSSDASALMQLITSHDTTLASAAAAGVKAQYETAVSRCRDALHILNALAAMRAEVVQGGETVLDDWLDRNRTHDKALRDLYRALRRSGGARNSVVDAAYRAEQAALAQLPSDNRAIIVILSEVAAGGLSQAVVAIEVARARIDQAIAEASPAETTSPG